jgi:hypothetical protein
MLHSKSSGLAMLTFALTISFARGETLEEPFPLNPTYELITCSHQLGAVSCNAGTPPNVYVSDSLEDCKTVRDKINGPEPAGGRKVWMICVRLPPIWLPAEPTD